nr:MAG TPA: hypothetical protein [Caudoviricetes sp.]
MHHLINSSSDREFLIIFTVLHTSLILSME